MSSDKPANPSAPEQEHYQVDATTGLRKVLEEEGGSAFKKYCLINVGKPGLWNLFKYELLTGLLGSLPGAAGYLLRQKLYRWLLGGMGCGVVIGRNVTIRHPHRIILGDRVVIDDQCVLDAKGDHDQSIVIGDDAIVGRNTVLSCKGSTIHLGRRANLSGNCTLISETKLQIGNLVLIAGHCYLIAGGNHGMDRTDVPIVDQPMVEKGGIVIGDHSWLGAQVTVLDGVHIGRDTVIAAGAVVQRTLPDYVIAGGVPAKILRERQSDR